MALVCNSRDVWQATFTHEQLAAVNRHEFEGQEARGEERKTGKPATQRLQRQAIWIAKRDVTHYLAGVDDKSSTPHARRGELENKRDKHAYPDLGVGAREHGEHDQCKCAHDWVVTKRGCNFSRSAQSR